MSSLIPWLQILTGLAGLYFGGEALVRGASRLALRLGLTPLVVGLTVVAFGTSSPELFVSLQATLKGQGDIAVGNIVGSNIGNIGAILALCAIVHPMRVAMQVLRFDMPVMLGVSVLFCGLLWDGKLGRMEGLLLIFLLVVYLITVLLLARREKEPAVAEEFLESMPALKGRLWHDLVYIAIGLVLLGVGSRFLIAGATTVARSFGMSEAVIGLTVVSIGTSLPELSASLVAAFKKEGDIAVGNVVGSNLFNMLAIGGISGAILPLTSNGVRIADYAVMLAFTLILLPFMKTGFAVKRWEGVVLLVTYVGYLAFLLSQPSVG